MKGFMVSHHEKDKNPTRSEKTKVRRKKLLAELHDKG